MTYILMTWYGDGDEPQLQTVISRRDLYAAIAIFESRRLRYKIFRLFVNSDSTVSLFDEEDNPI